MILAQIEKNGQTDDLLEKKLQIENMINDTTKAIETVDYRAENRKAGYVYIISNIGAFESKKLNKINTRREFFAVFLDEIKKEVRKNFDKTVEWIDVLEAEQYRQSFLRK